MGNEILSINKDTYILKYYFTRKISEFTQILCVRCGFWRSLPFKLAFPTVIPARSGSQLYIVS